ncbi:MAG: c-type cytochrome [Acidobacteriota bacterium]
MRHPALLELPSVNAMTWGWRIIILIVAVILAITAYLLFGYGISALPAPGRVESAFAMTARNWYLAREANKVPPPPREPGDVAAGSGLFGMECASCHGQTGRTPSPIGRSMYPRPADLGSAAVQKLSDRELFAVVRNGIRLSGMPGFAHINSDAQIWQLVAYIRSLGKAPPRH